MFAAIAEHYRDGGNWMYPISLFQLFSLTIIFERVYVLFFKTKLNKDRILKSLRERLHQGDVGIFFSVSGFTRESERETKQDNRRIRLIDPEKFFDLWIEHYNRIPEKSRKLLPVRPVWFLADSDSL